MTIITTLQDRARFQLGIAPHQILSLQFVIKTWFYVSVKYDLENTDQLTSSSFLVDRYWIGHQSIGELKDDLLNTNCTFLRKVSILLVAFSFVSEEVVKLLTFYAVDSNEMRSKVQSFCLDNTWHWQFKSAINKVQFWRGDLWNFESWKFRKIIACRLFIHVAQ